MIPHNLPWKPVAKELAIVAAREAGVYLYRLAKERIDTEKIGAKVREKLNGVRPHFEMEPEPEKEIPNGADPEGPSRRSRAARGRVRDENGRFIRKPPNPEGGDIP